MDIWNGKTMAESRLTIECDAPLPSMTVEVEKHIQTDEISLAGTAPTCQLETPDSLGKSIFEEDLDDFETPKEKVKMMHNSDNGEEKKEDPPSPGGSVVGDADRLDEIVESAGEWPVHFSAEEAEKYQDPCAPKQGCPARNCGVAEAIPGAPQGESRVHEVEGEEDMKPDQLGSELSIDHEYDSDETSEVPKSSGQPVAIVNDFLGDDSVYIENKIYGWLPATILERGEGEAFVRVQWPSSANFVVDESHSQPSTFTVDYNVYPEGCLPNQNELPKGDMVDLVHLHDAAILYNLHQRHASLKPYTRVGNIMVAMNPFHSLESLYCKETEEKYTQQLARRDSKDTLDHNYYTGDGLEPHIFEVSALAYKEMVHERHDQTILVTGDSGAGKTETVKILLSHLAAIPKTSAADIVARVCQSSPVFEAFGNAKTLRNDNSSRFGKFIQLQFHSVDDTHADMVGAFCTTYLMEKTRVVSHVPGERTYHIFYQLLSSSSEFKARMWDFFSDLDCNSFAYLQYSGILEHQAKLDAEKWEETVDALSFFQYCEDSLCELMRAVAVVLQLGNLVFTDDHNDDYDGDHNTTISSRSELHRLSEMTGIDTVDLEESMTCRILKTAGEDIRVKASVDVAKEWCDALAKEIYSRVFHSVVRRINETTASGMQNVDVCFISLLDIFGFECFTVNRFEQLCINYANERLHNMYVLDNFKACKEEYEVEGVDLYDFKLVDNSPILELLESRGGLISVLNEECSLPRGNNVENFVSKLKRQSQRRSSFIHQKLHDRTEFGVQHYAGQVVYSADNFVERNMDKLPQGIVECAAKSTNMVIRTEFERGEDLASPHPQRRGSIQKNRFVLQKFQVQLRSLISAMENSSTRYVRCIKPNDEFAPQKTDLLGTMQQLRCSGLMTAIAMTREGYPDKFPYDTLLKRYGILEPSVALNKVDPQEQVSQLLLNCLRPNLFKCGNSRVYFKSGCRDRLEELRRAALEKAATRIQSSFRRMVARSKLKKVIAATLTIQKKWRGVQLQRDFYLKCRSALLISAAMRRHLACLSVERLQKHNAAIVIQTMTRRNLALDKKNQRIEAICVLQRLVRTHQTQAHFIQFQSAVRCLQSLTRMKRVRKDIDNQHQSANKLAGFVRILQAKVVSTQLQKERDATVKIQTTVRRFLRTRNEAAATLQRVFRQVLQQKQQRAASTKLDLKVAQKTSPPAVQYQKSILRSALDLLDQICCPGSAAT